MSFGWSSSIVPAYFKYWPFLFIFRALNQHVHRSKWISSGTKVNTHRSKVNSIRNQGETSFEPRSESVKYTCQPKSALRYAEFPSRATYIGLSRLPYSCAQCRYFEEKNLKKTTNNASMWCDPVESKCFRVEVLSSRKLLGGLEYLSYIAISVNRRVFILG